MLLLVQKPLADDVENFVGEGGSKGNRTAVLKSGSYSFPFHIHFFPNPSSLRPLFSNSDEELNDLVKIHFVHLSGYRFVNRSADFYSFKIATTVCSEKNLVSMIFGVR